MSKKIAITGASGYVGAHLCDHFNKCGDIVVRLCRNGNQQGWRLNQEHSFSGVNAIIHCAHDFHDSQVNIDGTKLLLEQAERDHVDVFIFVSSLAAYPGCKSIYGSTKLAIEDFVLSRGGIVVRPGTIYGGRSGGIMGAMERLVRHLPVVPLIGTGKASLFLIHIEDICRNLQLMVENPQPFKGQVLSLAETEPHNLKSIIRVIGSRFGKKPLLFPVPAGLILLVLQSAEAIGLRLPLRSDSLVSLLNANPFIVINRELGCLHKFSGVDLA